MLERTLTIRLSASDYATLRQMARDTGVSASRLIRDRLFGQECSVPIAVTGEYGDGNGRYDQVVAVRFNEADYRWVGDAAKTRRCSKSQLIRSAMVDYRRMVAEGSPGD